MLNNSCQWLDSNLGPLLSGATTQPIALQPILRPVTILKKLLLFSFNRGDISNVFIDSDARQSRQRRPNAIYQQFDDASKRHLDNGQDGVKLDEHGRLVEVFEQTDDDTSSTDGRLVTLMTLCL